MKHLVVGVAVAGLLAVAAVGQSAVVNGVGLVWPSVTMAPGEVLCGSPPVAVMVPGLGQPWARMSALGGMHLEFESTGRVPGVDGGAVCLFVVSLGALPCGAVQLSSLESGSTGDLLVDPGWLLEVAVGEWTGFDWLDNSTWFRWLLEVPETDWPLQPGWVWYSQAIAVGPGLSLHGNSWVSRWSLGV